MGGCSVADDLKLPSTLTLVLVGKTGNGKSSTGNSILGTKSFKSKRSLSGVTTTSELKTIKLKDGIILNVIDTPGMFDLSADPEFIRKQIVNCVYMARDGIHAFLVVFSICNRFSEDEQAVIHSLVTLFGNKVYNYIVIVFTGGDELEEDGKGLEDLLSDCPESLKEILNLCGNRCVLFDNKTKDGAKKSSQVKELLSFVNMVLEKNYGEPYTGLLTETRFERIIELLETKIIDIQKHLNDERVAREKAESDAREVQKQHEKKIQRLQEELAKAKVAKAKEDSNDWCAIM